MVFSFFRKKQPEPEEVKPSPPAPAGKEGLARTIAEPAPPPPPPTEMPFDPTLSAYSISEGIGEEGAGTEASSVVEEAAIYFANDLPEQSVGVLLQFLQTNPFSQDMLPWLMLFDLYQLSDEKRKFNELALRFVEKFERSAPIWESRQAGPEPVAGQKPAAVAAPGEVVALAGVLDAGCEAHLQRLLQTAQGGTAARLDLGAIESLEPAGSELLFKALQTLRKSGGKASLVRAESFVDPVKQAAEAGDSPAHWLLLLELGQWLAMEAEFEEWAVEYAIRFEVSPPSWEKTVLAKSAQTDAPKPAGEQPPAAGEEGFALHGVISDASQPQLRALADYAATRPEVRIDMSGVTRIDFMSAGTFVAALSDLSRAGKKVSIAEANEMVQALLCSMGAIQFATLLRKKHH